MRTRTTTLCLIFLFLLFQRALSSCHAANTHHKVRLWKCSPRHLSSQPSPVVKKVSCTSLAERCISTWNCMGFSCSEAYLKHLSSHSDIILLQEHWLWPFKLQKLSSAIDGYSAFGVSDSRLCDTSTLHRGCGGVAFLWRKSLSVTPVTLNVRSDRVCATELSLTSGHIEKSSSSSSMCMLPLPMQNYHVSMSAYIIWRKR